jgi:hypothetical protein
MANTKIPVQVPWTKEDVPALKATRNRRPQSWRSPKP